MLGPVALLRGSEDVFSGFKHLFDVLFVPGTITFGVGSISILWSELRTGLSVVYKVISAVGIAIGVVGLVGSVSYFAGVNLAFLIGGAIGTGSLIFAVVGIQIARTALIAIRANA